MFRQVILPDDVPGKLFLHSMPGRFETWDVFMAQARQAHLKALICLNPPEEVRAKSPQYQLAIDENRLPCEKWDTPFPNYSAPVDRARFMNALTETANAA